ncbi:MAG: RNA-binding protein [Rhodothermales bacterium]|nr:RNA-binding protein [Rhodothermales bacterium]
MSKKLYVGNLPWSVTEEDIRGLFSPIGEILSVSLITERETGRSRGFGFVEMSNDDAKAAISRLNGQDFNGRQLRISEAEERIKRAAGFHR